MGVERDLLLEDINLTVTAQNVPAALISTINEEQRLQAIESKITNQGENND